MSDSEHTLEFSCPHCGGPLHVVESDVECKYEHRFTVAEVLLEQARTSSQAAWQAVSALTQRAQTSRWAARDPDLYRMGSAEDLERAAVEDDETAAVLRRQAQMLDLTVWRLSRGADEEESA